MIRFFFSKNYNSALERIEDHIFKSTQSLKYVTRFLDRHDEALQFIADHPATPTIHLTTGEQSWLFAEGRYRIFFKTVYRDKELHIFLTHLIDNKEANIGIYPNNTIPTYDEDS